MNKILIIDREPFGNLIDTYRYTEVLSGRYKITYVCFEKNSECYSKKSGSFFKKSEYFGRNSHTFSNGFRCYSVPHRGPKFLRGIFFLLVSILFALFCKGFCMIVYFPYCEWMQKILFWKKLHLDIRTLSVNKDARIREKEDERLRKSCRCFRSISVINREIAKKIGLKEENVFVLPIGADRISDVEERRYEHLHLLYVGTLYNREIISTLQGVDMFLKRNEGAVLTYDILGDGEEFEQLREFVERNRLSDRVCLHGRVEHSMLKKYFDRCNVGVSFVPIRDYYQNQPVTKTLEYIASGLFCIATATTENRKVINERNGLLIDDNAEPFCRALEQCLSTGNRISGMSIQKSVDILCWEDVVRDYLLPIVKHCTSNS